MKDLFAILVRLIPLAAVPLFIISFAAYLYLTQKMKKLYDPDLDEYHWEVEDRHPAIREYERYARLALALATLAALLLFTSLVL